MFPTEDKESTIAFQLANNNSSFNNLLFQIIIVLYY